MLVKELELAVVRKIPVPNSSVAGSAKVGRYVSTKNRASSRGCTRLCSFFFKDGANLPTTQCVNEPDWPACNFNLAEAPVRY